MTKIQNSVLNIWIQDFEFVSDFVFSASNLLTQSNIKSYLLPGI